MSFIILNSQEEYENFIKSDNLSVIHFYTPWAEQCSQVNNVMHEISTLAEYKDVKFAKIEAELFPDVSVKAGIVAVPTVVLTSNGKILDRIEGANPSAISEKIKCYYSIKATTPSEVCKKIDNIDDRLKRLINQAPCMVFMKGSPTNPRCKFSKQIISILDCFETDYQTFDILQDNDVREGLKKFINWPTYPQLYVNGQFIGGVDIVTQLYQSQELKSLLPKKESTGGECKLI